MMFKITVSIIPTEGMKARLASWEYSLKVDTGNPITAGKRFFSKLSAQLKEDKNLRRAAKKGGLRILLSSLGKGATALPEFVDDGEVRQGEGTGVGGIEIVKQIAKRIAKKNYGKRYAALPEELQAEVRELVEDQVEKKIKEGAMAQLTDEEKAALKKRGYWVKEKCDRCGKPLTKSLVHRGKGDEVYCSQTCKKGELDVADDDEPKASKRKGKKKVEKAEKATTPSSGDCKADVLAVVRKGTKTGWTTGKVMEAVSHKKEVVRKAVQDLIVEGTLVRKGKALVFGKVKSKKSKKKGKK